MRSALLDRLPDGTEVLFHREGDGNWIYEKRADVSPILDANKEAQNHCDTRNAARDMRLVARIPPIFILKWKNELGIDYYNRDHQPAVNRLLNSNEYRWLRTDDSVL